MKKSIKEDKRLKEINIIDLVERLKNVTELLVFANDEKNLKLIKSKGDFENLIISSIGEIGAVLGLYMYYNEHKK